MNKNYIFTYIVLLLSLIFTGQLSASEKAYNWIKMGSSWTCEESKASVQHSNSVAWNYYELSNYNSLISLKSFKDNSSISFKMKIFDRQKSPAEVMASFAITSEYKSWYYHLYAFKFSGGFWGINKVSLIHSDRLDKNKKFATKNNIFVKELASADHRLSYGKMYNFRIVFDKENVILFIDDKKVITSPMPKEDHSGHIAFSTRNTKISLDKVEVKNDDKILFKDDFDKDSIYVKVIKAHRSYQKNKTVE